MAEVETPVPAVETTLKEIVVIEETTTTTVEVNGGDHNNSEKATEVDKVTTESVNGNGTTEATENGDTSPKHAGEAASEEPAVTPVPEGEAEKVEAEKKEVTPKVILHQYPPGKDIPSLSTFCLKLETYLRLNKIPYENQYGFKLGKKGKLPWIEYQGERKTDSSLIIDYLKEKFGVHIDDELSEEQKAIGRSVQVMIEENSFWGLLYNRYIDNYNEYKKILAPTSGGGIGFNVGVKMNQRKARTSLEGHGLGRHSRDEIYTIVEKDLKAVSVLLGEKDYLLGNKISTFDCTVFAFFANVLWCGIESPMSMYVRENAKNLVSYCERMKEECWSDWADMVLGDKAEPALKKGFSFRKKRAKPTKSKGKEDDKEGEKSEDEKKETSEEEKTEEQSEVCKEEPAGEDGEEGTTVEPVVEEKTLDEKPPEEKSPIASKSDGNSTTKEAAGGEQSEPDKISS